MDRRTLLTSLAVGVAGVLAGCTPGQPRSAGPTTDSGSPTPTATGSAGTDGPDPSPVPTPTSAVQAGAGGVQLIYGGDPSSSQIALTIDDGTAAAVVSAYVQFAQDSGIPITFSPNGAVAANWEPHAPALRELVTAGQVQIANHTYHHWDVTTLGPTRLRGELERNEAWIAATFGAATRPWFRPPYGRRNPSTDEAAAAAGWNRILMWNGSLGDAAVLTPDQIMTQARMWLRPGVVMLGHANHPAITGLYPQLVALIKQRDLSPVTLTTMFAHYVPASPSAGRRGTASPRPSGRPTGGTPRPSWQRSGRPPSPTYRPPPAGG